MDEAWVDMGRFLTRLVAVTRSHSDGAFSARFWQSLITLGSSGDFPMRLWRTLHGG